MFELIKWEYKVIPIKTQIHSDHFQAEKKPVIEDVQSDLNALGDEGWELVSIQDITLPDARMFTVAYLKRQKQKPLFTQTKQNVQAQTARKTKTFA